MAQFAKMWGKKQKSFDLRSARNLKKNGDIELSVICYPESNEEKKAASTKDSLTSIIGEFGLYQTVWCLLLALTGLSQGWLNLSNKFLTTQVDYWCGKPMNLNITTEEWLNLSAPLLESGDFDKCHIFDIDYDLETSRPDEETTPVKKCTSWDYDTTYYENTVRQRWDLVCDNELNFSTYANSAYFAGTMVGIFSLGLIADWFGRKIGYQIFVIGSLVFSVASYFVDNPFAWLAIRFFCGATYLAMNTAANVWRTEITSGIWRSRTQHWFHEGSLQVSQLTLGGLVYLIHDMKNLEVVLIVAIVPILMLSFFMHESPRWLLTQGKTEEAKSVIKTILKWNQKPASNLDLVQPLEKTTKKANLFQILKHRGMRRNLMVLAISWFATSMGFYGLTFNTPTFDWNVYLVFVFPSFVNLPISFLMPTFENKLGRKVMLFGSQFVAGSALLATTLIPDGKFAHNWPIVALCWIGTIACATSFGTNYTITKELFPTPVRTTALTTSSMFARVGSILSPFVALLSDISPVLSLAVYGSFLILGAMASIFVWPETKHHKMTESIEECEELATTKNTWLICTKMCCK